MPAKLVGQNEAALAVIDVQDVFLRKLPVPGRRPLVSPEGSVIFDKRVFGVAGQDDIPASVPATGRGGAVPVGLGTGVRVAQAALGLLSAGHRVAGLSDATASPGDDHAAGLGRMRDAGVTISTAQGIYYEWVLDPDTLARVKSLPGPDLPEGLNR